MYALVMNSLGFEFHLCPLRCLLSELLYTLNLRFLTYEVDDADMGKKIW